MDNIWGQVKQAAASGVLMSGYSFARNFWYVGENAPRMAKRADTISAMLALMSSGDVGVIGPQRHAEGNLIIPATLSNITLIGAGGRGACYIEPSSAGYALNVKGNAAAKNGKRFRAFGCKFEGPTGTVVLLNGDANYNASDALFSDCEFAWGGSGILFDDSGYGYPTQIFIERCKFHNLTAVGVGLAASGGVTNLILTDSVFDNQEDGTPPTDYIKVDRSGDTGVVSGCRFATATNATGVLTIAAGIMWMANATEAGWSTETCI